MNTSSTVKIYSSGKYKYIYVYFKYGKNIIRIPTGLKAIEGKMTQQNLFSARVDGYEELNRQIKRLSWQVDSYIRQKLRGHFPKVSQEECKEFLKNNYHRDTLYRINPGYTTPLEDEEKKQTRKRCWSVLRNISPTGKVVLLPETLSKNS